MVAVAERTYFNPENQRIARVGILGVGLVFGFMTVLLLLSRPYVAPLTIVAGLVSAWLLDRLFRRPRVELSAGGLRVVNPFSIHEIGWDEIAEIREGRLLRLDLVDHSHVLAWAIQNSNWSALSDSEGYADEVATEIRASIESAGK